MSAETPNAYKRAQAELSELTLGLMALCDCNRIRPDGRPRAWAWNDSLPWPHLRRRIRVLDEEIREWYDI